MGGDSCRSTQGCRAASRPLSSRMRRGGCEGVQVEDRWRVGQAGAACGDPVGDVVDDVLVVEEAEPDGTAARGPSCGGGLDDDVRPFAQSQAVGEPEPGGVVQVVLQPGELGGVVDAGGLGRAVRSSIRGRPPPCIRPALPVATGFCGRGGGVGFGSCVSFVRGAAPGGGTQEP